MDFLVMMVGLFNESREIKSEWLVARHLPQSMEKVYSIAKARL